MQKVSLNREPSRSPRFHYDVRILIASATNGVPKFVGKHSQRCVGKHSQGFVGKVVPKCVGKHSQGLHYVGMEDKGTGQAPIVLKTS